MDMRHPSARTRRPITALVAALAAFAFVAGACSSSDDETSKSSDEKETTTTTEKVDDDRALEVGQTVLSSDEMDTIDSDMQTCIGEAMIDEYGDDAEDVAAKAEGEGTKLDADETAVVVAAVDECIPAEAFTEFFLATIYQEMGLDGATDDEIECFAASIDGEVGQFIDSVRQAGDEPPAAMVAALDECVSTDTVAIAIETGLRESGGAAGFTEEQIVCIADIAAPATSFGKLVMGDSSQLEAEMQAAVASCPA